VFAGAIIGFAFTALVSALWFALAYSSDVAFVADYVHWFIGVTAIVGMFIAGLVAGGLAGEQNPGSGLVNGVTTWALLLVALLGASVPSAVRASSDGTIGTTLWTTFWVLLLGLGAGAAGGLVGGGSAERIEEEQRVRGVMRGGRAVLSS
jgi:hypothetical protein